MAAWGQGRGRAGGGGGVGDARPRGAAGAPGGVGRRRGGQLPGRPASQSAADVGRRAGVDLHAQGVSRRLGLDREIGWGSRFECCEVAGRLGSESPSDSLEKCVRIVGEVAIGARGGGGGQCRAYVTARRCGRAAWDPPARRPAVAGPASVAGGGGRGASARCEPSGPGRPSPAGARLLGWLAWPRWATWIAERLGCGAFQQFAT